VKHSTGHIPYENPEPVPIQIRNFIVHLRLHYQFFILSGGFLLGGLIAENMNLLNYMEQFLVIHVLLFGGATAYNSYWDRDEGPIGGIKSPPRMYKWMWFASLGLQFAGFLFILSEGWLYVLLYSFSFLLFWLYSSPLFRWKSRPILSLIVIGFSTGTNSFLLGFIAAGGFIDSYHIALTAFGVAFILLSLYPVSQIFQMDEDRERGDQTFAVRFGQKGVKLFFINAYLGGLLLVTLGFSYYHQLPALIFGVLSLVSFSFILKMISGLTGEQMEYPLVMKIKFVASLSFVLFIIGMIVLKYQQTGISWLDRLFNG
jgi:4-hydroxybenzoate polyprenyltransferase